MPSDRSENEMQTQMKLKVQLAFLLQMLMMNSTVSTAPAQTLPSTLKTGPSTSAGTPKTVH